MNISRPKPGNLVGAWSSFTVGSFLYLTFLTSIATTIYLAKKVWIDEIYSLKNLLILSFIMMAVSFAFGILALVITNNLVETKEIANQNKDNTTIYNYHYHESPSCCDVFFWLFLCNRFNRSNCNQSSTKEDSTTLVFVLLVLSLVSMGAGYGYYLYRTLRHLIERTQDYRAKTTSQQHPSHTDDSSRPFPSAPKLHEDSSTFQQQQPSGDLYESSPPQQLSNNAPPPSYAEVAARGLKQSSSF